MTSFHRKSLRICALGYCERLSHTRFNRNHFLDVKIMIAMNIGTIMFRNFEKIFKTDFLQSKLLRILSTVMLNNDKLCKGNVRLHLATPEICQARNSSINPGINLQAMTNENDIDKSRLFLMNKFLFGKGFFAPICSMVSPQLFKTQFTNNS